MVKVTLNVVVDVVEVERHKHQRKRDRSTDIIRKNKCLETSELTRLHALVTLLVLVERSQEGFKTGLVLNVVRRC